MSRDPYHYFRIEARELLSGLSHGVLELEKGGASELAAKLLRLAHTLKGASRVVKQPAIAELAHAIEGELAPHRDGAPMVPETPSRLLRLVDQIEQRLSLLGEGTEAQAQLATLPDARAAPEPAAEPSRGRLPVGPAVGDEFDTVRVDVAEADALLAGVAQMSSDLAALQRSVEALDELRYLSSALVASLGPATGASARARALADDLRSSLSRAHRRVGTAADAVGRDLSRVHDRVNGLRLVPVSAIFPLLRRAARDAALALGRRVELRVRGGETRLDGHVLSAIRDALQHVVRNAVAHGIESPERRASEGKAPVGLVELAVTRAGPRVRFACRDDGGGIDVEAVRRKAAALGRVTAAGAAAMTPPEVLRLLLGGGVSTAGSVSEVAGRGLGLDVVRDIAQRLRGELVVGTDAGRGTTVTIEVPISLSALTALVVGASGVVACIPLDAVRSTRFIGIGDVVRAANGEVLLIDGEAVPYASLGAILGAHDTAPCRGAFVVESDDGAVALGVDELCGVESIVVRSLPSPIVASPVVFAATLDAEGRPALVLEPRELAEVVRRRIAQDCVPRVRRKASVLVVDDSMTTRMLEQSILESAGYEVELAVSGEEGLEKAMTKSPDLFLVDVEMPGMDGFVFVERTREDPRFRTIPAILVTSRDSSDDRQRGRDAGASGYIVKGEFDQRALLKTIAELLG